MDSDKTDDADKYDLNVLLPSEHNILSTAHQLVHSIFLLAMLVRNSGTTGLFKNQIEAKRI